MEQSENAPASVQGTPAQLITAGEIVLPLGERMPPVTEGQVNTALPTENKESPFIDKRGAPFDPARHASENGRPKTTKDGFFYSAKLGKRGKNTQPGEVKETASPATGGAESERPAPTFAQQAQAPKFAEPEKPIAADEFDLMAEMVLQTAYGPAMILFSEDARPNAEEHAALKQSYAAWFRVKGIKDFSPGWGAVICTIAVAVKKTEKPTVRERAAQLFQKIKTALNKTKKPVVA